MPVLIRRAAKAKEAAEERVQSLKKELADLKRQLAAERAMRVRWEGEVRQLQAERRRARGARPRPGDDLLLG